MTTIEAEVERRGAAHRAAASQAAELERWRALVGTLGAEVAASLTAALDRVVSLSNSGRIDRHGLRALREDIERARQVGIESQQLARLAGGRVRQSHERVDLTRLLDDVLAHRAREIQARGLDVRRSAAPALQVLSDPSLLFGLFDTLLSWAFDAAGSAIELGTDLTPWPAQARLSCRFATRASARGADGLDTMHWRLLEQTAQVLGASVERQVGADAARLTLAFARTVNEALDGASVVEIDDGFAPSMNSKPLAGSHVLVVAQRRELRAEIREALRDMGLILDFSSSVDDAAAFCRDGLPHAIVVESLLCGERFDALRHDIAAAVPQFAFIEVVEQGRAFEMSGFTPASMSRVGRDALAQALPTALLFELSRHD